LSRLARSMVLILKSGASTGFTSRRGTISPEVASRSLLNNAVGQIGGQARHSQGRGFATPRIGMAGRRTPRVVMIWSLR
jgi:hypothetical protein